ncbi:hypothetical protein PRIEUP_LOCUS6689 [Pristimantis euphronides]
MSSLLELGILPFLARRNALCRQKPEDEFPRRVWVHPLVSQPYDKGHFAALYDDLRGHPEKFVAFLRLSIPAFLEALRLGLTYQDTQLRRCISPEERLLVTLRFLATGNTFARCTSNSSDDPRSLLLSSPPVTSSGTG